MQQINMFELSKPKYEINKPIRLIELFAGIGSQAKALTNLGINFEHYRICEFDKYAVSSYNAIHNTNFATSDITKITAEDLGIVETDKYEYIMTYSFPCTDLSLAGKQKGMKKGDSTRSGLLWEVERLLDECKELPQVLLMENVPEVIGTKNVNDFNKWHRKLEKLGYSNYHQILNAKDFGIPQNRKRCFMVSILGNYYYQFPHYIPLELRLKDVLEDKVDEKYYLSDDMIKYITSNNEKWTGNNGKSLVNKSIASTINTGEGSRRCDASNYVIPDIEDENIDLKVVGMLDIKGQENVRRVYDANGLSPTLTTMEGGNRQPKVIVNDNKNTDSITIYEATKKGYVEAHEGDGVYINRPHQKRGVVQKGMIQTIKSSCNDIGVVVRGNYSPSRHNASRVVDISGLAPTVMENHGTVTAIAEEKSLFTDLEKQMITEDGNIKRYIDSDVVDKFEEGDCADISFPNGYNKGNRVYKGYSPTLNGTTVKSFIVKVDEDKKDNIYSEKSLEKIRNNITDTDGCSKTITANPQRATIDSATLICEKVIVDDTYRNREPRVYTETSPALRSERAGLKVVEYGNGEEVMGMDVVVKEKFGRFGKQVEETARNNECNAGDTIDPFNKKVNKSGICPTITTRPEGLKTAILPITNKLRIRKLTPKECFRLMGFSDEDFESASQVNSNSQLYKQAGNSIVVNVLEAIFKEFIEITTWEPLVGVKSNIEQMSLF